MSARANTGRGFEPSAGSKSTGSARSGCAAHHCLASARVTRSQKPAICAGVAKPRRSRALLQAQSTKASCDGALPCASDRDHPLGEVVDLLKALPARDREMAGAPQELQRHLVRMPVPKAAARPLAVAEIARHDRAVLPDVVEHRLDPAVVVMLCEPAAIAAREPRPVALEADLPVRVEAGRDDRGVVGPVLEQPRLALEEALQQCRPVGLVAREQDHVMGARHHVDAVHLDEAHALDQREQAIGGELAARRIGQPLQRQDQAPRLLRRDADRHASERRD